MKENQWKSLLNTHIYSEHLHLSARPCRPVENARDKIYKEFSTYISIYCTVQCRVHVCIVMPVESNGWRRGLAPACTEPVFVNLLRSLGIDSQPGGPVRQSYLSYRAAKLHRMAESIPRNRFLGSTNVYKYGLSRQRPPLLRKLMRIHRPCFLFCLANYRRNL